MFCTRIIAFDGIKYLKVVTFVLDCVNSTDFNASHPLSFDVRHQTFFGPLLANGDVRVCLHTFENDCHRSGVEVFLFITIPTAPDQLSIQVWHDYALLEYSYPYLSRMRDVIEENEWFISWADGVIEIS